MGIEFVGGEILIDAEQLAPLLDVAARDLPELMRRREVTGICERGEGDDAGWHRLSFFYRNRRVRLSVDPAGRVDQSGAIDFGDRPLPPRLRRPEG